MALETRGGGVGGRQASHERRVVPPYIAHLNKEVMDDEEAAGQFLLLLKSRVKLLKDSS